MKLIVNYFYLRYQTSVKMPPLSKNAIEMMKKEGGLMNPHVTHILNALSILLVHMFMENTSLTFQ